MVQTEKNVIKPRRLPLRARLKREWPLHLLLIAPPQLLPVLIS